MSKHTPGPWAFCNDTLCQANGKYLHLGVWQESNGIGKAAEANKRLIAAAPDLLAALEMVVRGYGVTFQDAAIRDAASAAIAKATGSAA